MTHTSKLIASILICLPLFSCATPELTDGGKKIRVLDPADIGTCRKLGQSSATVPATALGIERPIETLSIELETIVRNSAGNMGGDTIVPLTTIEQGKQSFEVYKCIDPAN